MMAQASGGDAPLLSVVIPAYNCADLLERSVGSACRLDEGRAEVIVIDDGSTDHTTEVLVGLKEIFENLMCVRIPNSGISIARNVGTGLANGKYLAYLDADDEILDIPIAHLKGFHGEMVRLGVIEVAPDGEETRRIDSFSDSISGKTFFTSRQRSGEYFTPAWAYIYNREWLSRLELRFMPSVIHEDMIFTVEALFNAKSIIGLDSVCYRYIRRQGSIMFGEAPEKLGMRLDSLNHIQVALIKLANQNRDCDLWDWICITNDYARSCAGKLRTRRAAFIELKMELRLFLLYWPKHELSRKFHQKWRISRALSSILNTRAKVEPHSRTANS